MNDNVVYLTHILESIQKIEGGLSGGKDVFLKSDLLQDAIVRNLQVSVNRRNASPMN